VHDRDAPARKRTGCAGAVGGFRVGSLM
jgi:hypothetical protein